MSDPTEIEAAVEHVMHLVRDIVEEGRMPYELTYRRNAEGDTVHLYVSFARFDRPAPHPEGREPSGRVCDYCGGSGNEGGERYWSAVMSKTPVPKCPRCKGLGTLT